VARCGWQAALPPAALPPAAPPVPRVPQESKLIWGRDSGRGTNVLISLKLLGVVWI